jgi:S1-C subfamily serine protease
MGKPSFGPQSCACFYLPVTVLKWVLVALTLALVSILGTTVLRAPGALERVDQLPRIAGPTSQVPPPDTTIAADPDVRGVSRSVVRVLGTACGLGVEGSGWVASPGLVVTNAHVLAGEDDTTVTTVDGASLDATPVRYDPDNDLALLRIDPSLPAMEMAPEPQRGTAGAVLGYPENGPYALSPARLGDTSDAVSEDAYGNGPIRRSIAFLRGNVHSGNSGGPLIDSRGRVLATVFAATTSGPPGGFAIPNDVVVSALAGPTSAEVDTVLARDEPGVVLDPSQH